MSIKTPDIELKVTTKRFVITQSGMTSYAIADLHECFVQDDQIHDGYGVCGSVTVDNKDNRIIIRFGTYDTEEQAKWVLKSMLCSDEMAYIMPERGCLK